MKIERLSDGTYIKQLDPIEQSLQDQINEEVAIRAQEDEQIEIKFDSITTDLDSNITKVRNNLRDYIITESDTNELLQSNIEKEEAARIQADNDIQNQIDQEITDRINSDNILQDNINLEEQSRKDADDQIIADLQTEEASRINEDEAIRRNIQDEEDARIFSDQELQDQINVEESERINQDQILQDNIDAEESERINQDDKITTDLNSEIQTRIDEDTRLDDRIDTEITDRINEVDRLDTQINNVEDDLQTEEETRSEQVQDLQAQLDTEIQNRIDEDAELQSQLNSEISSRQTADDSLTSQIDAETQNRTSEVSRLDTKIDNEISDRTAANTDIQTQIDALDAILTQEEETRFNADVNLQDNIDSEEAARIAADNDILDTIATVQAEINEDHEDLNIKIDNEINNRRSEDDNLQNQIDTVITPRLDNLRADLISETDVRTSEVSRIDDRIDTEITDRTDADDTLQNNIDAEEQSRISADNTLQSNLTDEATTRATADQDLQDQIDAHHTEIVTARSSFESLDQRLDNMDSTTESELNDIKDTVFYTLGEETSTSSVTDTSYPLTTSQTVVDSTDYFILTNTDGTEVIGTSGDPVTVTGFNPDTNIVTFSEAPNDIVNIKYAIRRTLSTLPADALITYDVIGGRIDAEITEVIGSAYFDNTKTVSIDGSLDERIEQEITDRNNTDTAIWNEINDTIHPNLDTIESNLATEISERESEISRLDGELSNEIITRGDADTGLQNQIDDLYTFIDTSAEVPNADYADNADKLDDLNSSQFLRSDVEDTYTGPFLTITGNKSIDENTYGQIGDNFALLINSPGNDSGGILINAGDNNNDETALEIVNQGSSKFRVHATNGNVYAAGNYYMNNNLVATQTWVNDNADVPNADYADNANMVDGLHAASFLRSDTNDTMNAGTNTRLTILSDDDGMSSLYLHGNDQGTGRLFVGQSNSYGGGIEYNGDNDPTTSGAGSDQLTLYRITDGTQHWTARNHVNDNDWYFRGDIYANSDKLLATRDWVLNNSDVPNASYADNAGKLDGIDSNQFLRSDTSDTMDGKLSMNGDISFTNIINGESKGLVWTGLTDTHSIFVEETGDSESTELIIFSADNGTDGVTFRNKSSSNTRDILSIDYNGVISHQPLNVTADLSMNDDLVATRTWVNSSADVPNADYADNSGRLDGHRANYFAIAGHNHDTRYVNEGQSNSITQSMLKSGIVSTSHIDSAINWDTLGVSTTGHNHDSRYYTESEIDELLDDKSDIRHLHYGVYYTMTEVDHLLDNKSNTGHTHSYLPLSGGIITDKLTISSDNKYLIRLGDGNASTSGTGIEFFTLSSQIGYFLGNHYDGESLDGGYSFHIGSDQSKTNVIIDGNGDFYANGNQKVATQNWVNSNYAIDSHTHNGHDVKVLGNRLTVDSDGKIRANNNSARRAGMYGIYDNNRISHIWSMGSTYQIDNNGETFGNLYGMAYKHTNNTTGGTMAGGHQIVICHDGTPGVALGMEGNIWAKGDITGNKVWNAVYNDLAELFKADTNVKLEPHQVVVMNDNGEVTLTNKPEDGRVIGVYSNTYGHLLGGEERDKIDDHEGYIPIGISGRVKVRVKGKIAVGDLLTTSDIPGVAIKSENKKLGTIFGKAMQTTDDDGLHVIWALITTI